LVECFAASLVVRLEAEDYSSKLDEAVKYKHEIG